MYFKQKPFMMSSHFAGPHVPALEQPLQGAGVSLPFGEQGITCICTPRAACLPARRELLLTSFRRRVTPIIRLVSYSWLTGVSGKAACPMGSHLPQDSLPVPTRTQAPECHTIKATGKAATCFNIKTKSQI